MTTARNRFLGKHGTAHEVTGVGKDGARVILRRFAAYDDALLYCRGRQPNYSELRIQTISAPDDAPFVRSIPPQEIDTCETCRNKLLWAREAYCTVDNKRHRLHFFCKNYTELHPN